MSILQLFLPCAAGVEQFLAEEVHRITGLQGNDLLVGRAGVVVRSTWADVLRLNLHSRLAQRVLIQLAHAPYQTEHDLYEMAAQVRWEDWFGTQHNFKVDITAQHSPLRSLNFATLRVKDAVVDRFRQQRGARPDVQTRYPDVRLYVHLDAEHASLYIDTSGEPLFKRGWRQDKGDAPLKETLAAAMLVACGWDPLGEQPVPLYDPCCGSGTIVIEAALMACQMAPGLQRRFGFEKLALFRKQVWQELKEHALAQQRAPGVPMFGSDVAHRMVDFAQRNAQRAGVAHAVELRGGDALQRMPPCDQAGVLLLNPPYGERIAAAGVAGRHAGHPVQRGVGREVAQTDDDGEFFVRLAAHWKKNYAGWSAFMLTSDMKLPTRMRLKESRRIPMWNGPIECRLFRFDMIQGSARSVL